MVSKYLEIFRVVPPQVHSAYDNITMKNLNREIPDPSRVKKKYLIYIRFV